jgi:3-oxoadipate CoA-transferase, beta subunit
MSVTGFGEAAGRGEPEIAARAALDIAPGSYVNLGIGRPTSVADALDPAAGITLHTDGMLGAGPHSRGDGSRTDN